MVVYYLSGGLCEGSDTMIVNNFLDGFMREMKDEVGNVGSRLWLNGGHWSLIACLLAEDACSVRKLQRPVNEFSTIFEEAKSECC